MTETSPWDDIAIPESDFNVRQVPIPTPVPCFWGRDVAGDCLFIVELEGDHGDQFRQHRVTVRGIEVDLRSGEMNRQRLLLTLDRHVDRDLFGGFCKSLASALEQATDSASALSVALTHIRRWKAFLSGGPQRLSAEEVRGLFAELAFLLELLDRNFTPKAAVEAWLGSEMSQHDYELADSAVEIKSLSGAERNAVRISSEDQLESMKERLFLRTYRLSALRDSSTMRTLNSIVREVEERLDSESITEFDRKLVIRGYAPLPDYDEPSFAISEVRTYLVAQDFPRLIRSRLDVGIRSVSYEIELEHIPSHQCDSDAIFKEQ
ncbi:MAG TPA: PD-(D/E)XK motif protein [Acidobacteriaceae bacterium]|nr:PD-(D/E)XK motif protein [Acidobacteriaceae bacterium]